MNAPKHTPVAIKAAADTEIRDAVAAMRAQVLRLLVTAEMVREGAVAPNWDSDIAIPAMQLNANLSLIEEVLPALGSDGAT
ncbi:MAG: hypothetical protein QM756_11140 [Polyangiaceae bacterium]